MSLTMKRRALITTVAALLLVVAGQAVADWKVGDPYKMHYPQLPDPNGWDVNMTNFTLADDFRCTQSGPITDIHFWESWKADWDGVVTGATVSIYAASATGGPDGLLWSRTFVGTITQYQVGYGVQGWDDPQRDTNCVYPDHNYFYEVNIVNIDNPFYQVEGQIYWLALQVTTSDGVLGWKTTLDPWGAHAMYWTGTGWEPIAVCTQNMPVDLAFVITPEPTTMCLLGLGGLVGLIRRGGRK